MKFKLLKISQKSSARLGLVKTAHGMVKTPFFMPIATKGAVKTLDFIDLKQLSVDIILGNTYHLYLQPGDNYIKKVGGLRQFINWSKPILTDSGGYQIFSLGAKREDFPVNNEATNKSARVRLNEEGVEFQSPLDGSKHFLTPEKSINIQMNLGSDIMMALDECPAADSSYDYINKSINLTTRWAARCQKYFFKKNRQQKILVNPKQALFAIVQGGIYADLRARSAASLVKLNFDGYALGGLAVGEPREKMYQVLSSTAPLLPVNKPRYLMGVGRPEEIITAVKKGIDMFDCVIPTREGRHGRLFVRNIKKKLGAKDFYAAININNSKYQKDFAMINKNSRLTQLRNYSRAYLHHLFKINEPLAQRLATLNNVEFYLNLMVDIREGINQGIL